VVKSEAKDLYLVLFYKQAISIPIYPDLSEEKQEFVFKTLTQLIDLNS